MAGVLVALRSCSRCLMLYAAPGKGRSCFPARVFCVHGRGFRGLRPARGERYQSNGLRYRRGRDSVRPAPAICMRRNFGPRANALDLARRQRVRERFDKVARDDADGPARGGDLAGQAVPVRARASRVER